MKNKLSVIVVFLVLLVAGLGCSLDRFTGSGDESGESGTKTEEAKKDGEKSSSSSEEVLNSGIPECDELAKYVNDNAEEIEGSFVGKAIILMYKNTILKSLEESAGKMNEEEKKKMGEVCAKTLKQLQESAEQK